MSRQDRAQTFRLVRPNPNPPGVLHADHLADIAERHPGLVTLGEIMQIQNSINILSGFNVRKPLQSDVHCMVRTVQRLLEEADRE